MTMTLMPARQLMNDQLTEKQFQGQITAYASSRGWAWYHTHDSRRSPAGFPDLVLVRAERCVFAEIKKQLKQPNRRKKQFFRVGEREYTIEEELIKMSQIGWLRALALTNNEVYLWQPKDWDEILEVLK